MTSQIDILFEGLFGFKPKKVEKHMRKFQPLL